MIQFSTLEKLANDKLVEIIVETCYQLHDHSSNIITEINLFKYINQEIRPYWICIPGKIRTNLLKRTNEILLGNKNSKFRIGKSSLYLLMILLASDIRQLRVELCCYFECRDQQMIFQLLGKEGNGLEKLELSPSTALATLDAVLLESTLHSLTNLQVLTIRNIASDNILSTIGLTCTNLVSLDVEHSKNVTNKGIKNLLLKTFKNGNAKKYASIERLWASLRVKLKNDLENKKIINNCSYLNECTIICHTLKCLKIANTKVTLVGVLLALNVIPNLESLGRYFQLDGRLWQMKKNEKLPIYNLRSAGFTRPTNNSIQLIAKCFPKLNNLMISEPLFNLNDMMYLLNLTSLHVYCAPTNLIWLEGLYKYLSNFGNQLNELTLRFVPGENSLAKLDVSRVIDYCRNLTTLTQDGGEITWSTNVTNISDRLERIQLGKIVSRQALINIIRLVKNLRFLHVFSCDELSENDLYMFIHTKIECFYIFEITRCEGISNTISILFNSPNIKSIGNLPKYAPEFQDINTSNNFFEKKNLNITMASSNHWFCSDCFPSIWK